MSHEIEVNGHTVPLFDQEDHRFPEDAANTDWILVKFDRFIDYLLSGSLRQDLGLEVHEGVDYDNTYLCKYEPKDLSPIINNDMVTHVSLFPNHAVAVSGLISALPEGTVTRSHIIYSNNSSDHDRAFSVSTTQLQDRSSDSDAGEEDKISLVISLHPNPKQTLQQVLEELRTNFGADHSTSEVFLEAGFIRVKLSRDKIRAAAEIDSIRRIEEVHPVAPASTLVYGVVNGDLLDDDVLPTADDLLAVGVPSIGNISCDGAGEIVRIADSGFDRGDKNNIHPAFTGRVLAMESASTKVSPDDKIGHGTHLAGCVLGDYSGLVRGTAPKANLISMAINFDYPPDDLFRRTVGDYGAPTIHSNSWNDVNSTGGFKQYGYNSNASWVDSAMFKYSELCVLFSAGNEGQLVTWPTNRQQQVGTWASAKNNIVVGACRSSRPVDDGGKYDKNGTIHSPKEILPMSSRGPTLEQRLGVDVVAPGELILSARSGNINKKDQDDYINNYGDPGQNDLLYCTGTSMATATVAGCVACLRQAYRDIYGRDNPPSGAMLKALIIHGAVDLEGTKFMNIATAQETSADHASSAIPKVSNIPELSTALTSSTTPATKTTPATNTASATDTAPEPSTTTTVSHIIMTPAPNGFQGYGMVNLRNSLAPMVSKADSPNGTLDGSCSNTRINEPVCVRTIKIPPDSRRLTVTLAYTDLPGSALQNKIKLEVRRKKQAVEEILGWTNPLRPDDKPKIVHDNVAKVIVGSPGEGEWDFSINVETKEAEAKYALVWSVDPPEKDNQTKSPNTNTSAT